MSDPLYPSRLRREASEEAMLDMANASPPGAAKSGPSAPITLSSSNSPGSWSLAKYRAFLDAQEKAHPDWAESLQTRRVAKLHLEARALLARSREGGSIQLRLVTLENAIEALIEASELRP